tara:strand:- start:3322 stop:4185 length:864 start_codon:yes stop_codon:yes gene_type:complete
MVDVLKNTENINIIDKNLILTCTCNQRYIKPAQAFLNSIVKNSPTINVLIRLVNVDKETIEQLKKVYKNYNIFFCIDNTELCDKRKIINHDLAAGETISELKRKTISDFKGVGWLYSEEAAYCSNIKYNTINQLLKAGVKCVVYMDVDTIVRKDIYDIYKTVLGYDIAMYIAPDEHLNEITQYGEKYFGWHAGIIIGSNTDIAIDFFKDVELRVNDNLYDMEADEDEFDHVFYMKKYNKQIKLNMLTKYYKDNGPEFNTKNAVWSGQTGAKICNNDYINEYFKYKDA